MIRLRGLIVFAVLGLASPAPAADYFGQFIYSFVIDADGNSTTRYLMSTSGDSSGSFLLGPNAAGVATYAYVAVVLLPSSEYVIKYMELDRSFTPTTFPVPTLHFYGGWTVPTDSLLVGDIAIGARTEYFGSNAVELTFLKDLGTPGLKGKKVVMDFGFSNINPFDP